MNPFNTTITQEDGKLVVGLVGKFDTAASCQAEKDLAVVFSRDDCDVVVDCSKLEYICSRGLRLVLSIYKHTRKTHHTASLVNYNDDIEEVFRISGFIRLFRVE